MYNEKHTGTPRQTLFTEAKPVRGSLIIALRKLYKSGFTRFRTGFGSAFADMYLCESVCNDAED